MKSLVVVAHPDDESIFFGGLIMENRDWDFTVVLATGGNQERLRQFCRACKILGVKKHFVLDLPDIYNRRLNREFLIKQLKKIRNDGDFNCVFTHSILGEYGHFHHQDVSYATHEVFSGSADVYSLAYNIFPDLVIKLRKGTYLKKIRIFWEIYHQETKRFLNFIPASATESFTKISLGEARNIYGFLKEGIKLNRKKIKKHSWLIPYLEQKTMKKSLAWFFGNYFDEA